MSWTDGIFKYVSLDAYAADVKSRGGFLMVNGYPFDPDKGRTGARFPDGRGGWRYELAPLGVRGLTAATHTAIANAEISTENALTEASDRAEGFVKGGVTGILGDVLGIPKAGIIAILVIGGGLIGYAALVQAGVVPPLRSVLKKGA